MPLIYSPRQGSYWLPAEIRPSITSISTSTRSMSSARPARRKAAKIARSYGTTAAMTHLTATTSVRSIAVVDLALYAISTAALLLLVRRAYSTFDMSWDAIAYHMPYAARGAGICDADCFEMVGYLETLYRALPPAADFLLRLFWKAAGFPEAANFVALVHSGCAGCVWSHKMGLLQGRRPC